MNEDKNETEELKEENAQEVPTEEKEDKKPEKKDKKAGRKKEDERLSALEAEKEALEKDKAALNDKYLRICAEYDNFRRRSQKEKDNLYGDIKADTVQKFLPVYDNLERALKQGTEDEAYRKGVEMIMTQFNATLEKLGVKKIESLGGTDEVRVLIGPENVAEELKDSSVVIASYDAGDNTRGLIGVVGPTRMDYSAVAAKLSLLAAGLSRRLGGGEAPPEGMHNKLIIKEIDDGHERRKG